MEVGQLVAQMREAIQAEKQAVLRALGALAAAGKLRTAGGKRLHAEPGAHLYRLTLDVDFPIPEGTRVQLAMPGQVGSGETLRHDVDGDAIECAVREDLGDALPPGTLELDSTFLLGLLEERLVAIAGGPAIPVVEPFHRERGIAFLTGDAPPRAPALDTFPELAESQEAAVRFAMAQDVGYLWGPPGTGKTQVVGHLVHALLERGERVLLTAHTNIATDNALLRALATRRLPRDAAIRVGYAAPELDRFDVSLEGAVDRALPPATIAEIEDICTQAGAPDRGPFARRLQVAAAIVDAQGPGGDPDLPARIATVAKQVEELERAILANARLVATTLTRCYSSRLFREFRTDAVLVDEASTASLATCFVAACMAAKRAIAIGDFRQLPTIVQANHPAAERWLGRHVFESSGADDVRIDHPLRAMLHEQWRMHPDISGVVSRVFYGGRLASAPAVVARSDAGPAVCLLDTSRLNPRSAQTPSGSKTNEVHAAVIADLVALARRAGRSVAVICPYRAQVRLVRETIRARHAEFLSTSDVEIFTVHRFQGRDKDVVLFDLTEGPGTRAGFLDDVRTRHAPNLINVAISRARDRLVIVGALEHLRASLGSQSTVMRVLMAARADGALQAEAGHERDRAALARFLGA